MFIQRKRIVADEELDTTPAATADVDPEATDLLFETEDVAELVAEVTGEPVEVTVEDDSVKFAVGDDEFGWAEEDARVRDYLCAPDGARARAILEYEKWGALGVKPGDGTKATTSMKTDWFDLVGEAGIEPHATLYMRNLGL